jgi:putative endonuclease
VYFVYLMHSDRSGRYYCGSTCDVDRRLLEHNNGECVSTCSGIPWKLMRVEPVETRAEAMRRERKIKARGIGRYLAVLGGTRGFKGIEDSGRSSAWLRALGLGPRGPGFKSRRPDHFCEPLIAWL